LREFDREHDGARIAVRFVAIGTQERVERFCGEWDAAPLCVGDPRQASYRAMGLGNLNLVKLFSDAEFKRRGEENHAAGFRQKWRETRPQDGARLPGAAVVDANGIVRWIRRGKHPGDLLPMEEMLRIASGVLAP
jgi:hypothetical protein